jgi:hypothetical protein
MDRCPICRAEYVQTEAEKLKDVRRQAWLRMFQGIAIGEPVNLLRDELMADARVSSEQAGVFIELAKGRLRQISRDRGIRLFAFGLMLWFIAFMVLALTGGFLIATGCVAIGFASVVVGAIKMITGWNLADNLGSVSNVSPLPDLDEMLKL